MIVQIYEIQTPREAEEMIALGVDHIGSVVLSAQEWKDRDIFETVRLCQSSGAKSSLIPLFSETAAVMRLIDYYRPDIIHFCESLCNGSPDRLQFHIDLQRQVRNRFPGVGVMRSIPIAPPGLAQQVPTLELGEQFEPASDMFLTDTYLMPSNDSAVENQPVAGFIGITGNPCDWTTARRLVENCSIPVILAGGISPDNVADGIKAVRPAGVDSCTGTNAHDSAGRPIRFKKDPVKVKRLVEAARSCQRTG